MLAQKLMGNLGMNLGGSERGDESAVSKVSNCPCADALVADDNEFNLVTF